MLLPTPQNQEKSCCPRPAQTVEAVALPRSKSRAVSTASAAGGGLAVAHLGAASGANSRGDGDSHGPARQPRGGNGQRASVPCPSTAEKWVCQDHPGLKRHAQRGQTG